MYQISTFCNRYRLGGEEFVNEYLRRNAGADKGISKDFLLSLLQGSEQMGFVCGIHYQRMENARVLLEKVKCAICSRRFDRKSMSKLHLSFNEKDEVSCTVAIETFLALKACTSSDLRTEEDNSPYDESIQHSWVDDLLHSVSFDESIDLLGVGEYTSLNEDTNDFADSFFEDEWDRCTLSELRVSFACRNCYSKMKYRSHPAYCNTCISTAATSSHSSPTEYERALGALSDPNWWDQDDESHEILQEHSNEVVGSLRSGTDKIVYSAIAYAAYVEKVNAAKAGKPKSRKTFQSLLLKYSDIVIVRSTCKGKGSILTSVRTIRQYSSSSSVQDCSSETLNPFMVKQDLDKIRELYNCKEYRERYQRGEWNIVQEIKRFPPSLWRFHWILLESTRDSISRRAAEHLVKGEHRKLSFPFSNGPDATLDDFYALPRRWYKKCIRIIAHLQNLVCARDGSGAGPFQWGLSVCGLLEGSKSLLSMMNVLGFSKSYDCMQRLRTMIAREEGKKDLKTKLVSSLMLKVAWDNLDTKTSSNVLRLVGKTLDWHGTVLISEQMPNTTPLLSRLPFKIIDRLEFPQSKDVIDKFVLKTSAVRNFTVIFAGLVALFRSNLMSKRMDAMVSIDFLLRLVLKGSCSGEPAVISNLILADKISNNLETAEYLMKEMQNATEKQSGEAGDASDVVRYCAMTADCPLFALMISLLYQTLDGECNPDYSRIIPLIGQMHLAMSFQEVIKLKLWDGGLDALAAGAGLSPSLAEVFRSKKEYKTNLRFFRQSAVVWMTRVIDVLFDDGDISEDTPELKEFSIVRDRSADKDTPSLHSMLTVLKEKAEKHGQSSKDFQESVIVNGELFGQALENLGEKIISAIEAKAAYDNDANFTFFARDGLLGLLCPSLALYYRGRDSWPPINKPFGNSCHTFSQRLK